MNYTRDLFHRYEDDVFDVTERGRGYQEGTEEDWRERGYSDLEEEWRGQGQEHIYSHGYDSGYDHRHSYGHEQGYDRGYDHGYDPSYNQGYGHREEEDDDRGQSPGYQYTEVTDEPRVIPDESLFRWLAVSYSSTHLTMTHNFHSSCHGDTSTGGHGIINRAKWKPITGSK